MRTACQEPSEGFHALEKEMAAHSSVLALRIPGTGVPGGLPSMGSHSGLRSQGPFRVGTGESGLVLSGGMELCLPLVLFRG